MKFYPKAWALAAVAVVAIGWSAFASLTDRLHDVVKSDGKIGHYKLLPVHYDPKHAQVVQERMAQALLHASEHALPNDYQIPTSALPAVRDQGNRGTCAYFATVALLETYYIARSTANANLNISEECLADVRNWEFDQGKNYTGADQPAQRPDPDGDLPSSIVQTVAANGVPRAVNYGPTNCVYDGSLSNGRSVALADYRRLMASGTGASFAYGKGLNLVVNTAPTIDQVRTLISHNTPVEIGLVVYDDDFTTSSWTFDPSQDNGNTVAGGHAIVLTGYHTVGSNTVFKFKNSWGNTWGTAGYGTIDQSLVLNGWGFDPKFDFFVAIQ